MHSPSPIQSSLPRVSLFALLLLLLAARPDHRRYHPPFHRDLSSPISSSLRLTPASVRRETQASTPPPPPPLLSLDGLSYLSPSPQPATPPQAAMSPSPPPPRGGLFASPMRFNGSPAPSAWWSPSREEKPREGSPMDGVMQHQHQQSPTTQSGQQSQQQQKVAPITLPGGPAGDAEGRGAYCWLY
jgi:nuclear pore complex protein Nup53